MINISESIEALALVILEEELRIQDKWTIPDELEDETLINAVHIFAHVLINKSFHNKKNAWISGVDRKRQIQSFWEDLYLLVKSHTGIDTKKFYK